MQEQYLIDEFERLKALANQNGITLKMPRENETARGYRCCISAAKTELKTRGIDYENPAYTKCIECQYWTRQVGKTGRCRLMHLQKRETEACIAGVRVEK